MRISDWSSDVCSSDLIGRAILTRLDGAPARELSTEMLRLKSQRGWVLHASNGPYWPSDRFMVPHPPFGHGLRTPSSASIYPAPVLAYSIRKRAGASARVSRRT